MLGSKKFEKIILYLTIIAMIFAAFTVCFPNFFSKISRNNAEPEYPTKLFGQDVINIEITANETEWDDMVENKMSKPYISCNLKIDGREFNNVGIRPKGNSSLTSIQNDKISYRVDFDHYIDNQTCYGLEQMVLNNLQADATYMKDYIAYDLMAYEGVNAPLHTFAFITLNGKPFGVYLAVEVYDTDYLSRVYGDTNIKLYNVKSSGLDEYENAIVDPETATVLESKGVEKATGMGSPGGPPPMGENPPSMGDAPPQGAMPPQMGNPENPNKSENTNNSFGNMQQPPGPPGGNGGDLVYIDDSTKSYNTIFANAVSKDTDAEDYAKIIRAIKYLNKQDVTETELEQYWNVDSILRYLAVHTFMVNGDSYTGSMKQNYFLAEQNGKVTVLPWDYNLSFGAFGGGPGEPPKMGEEPKEQNKELNFKNDQTTEVINHAIDTPTIGVEMSSRPLVSVLLSIEKYKEKYHQYLNDLTKFASGDFINKLEIVENAIYPYIERETISFYIPDAHKIAFDVLKNFLKLRSVSIQKQLKGDIPSETEKQKGADLVIGDFSINDMGSMGGPGGGPPMPEENGMGKMMPPPTGRQDLNGQEGQIGMMPPPPGMPEMTQTQGNTAYYTITVIAILILCIVFIGTKLFKRNY